MDLLWAMFGGGIMVGIAFWSVLDVIIDYWRERLDYEKEIWEARIEYERNKDKYQ